MRVCVGSAGRFHGFDLAREMERLGFLERLYTGYPRFKVDGLPPDKVSTFPWLLAPVLVAERIGMRRLSGRLNLAAIETYDAWMARNMVSCDVFHCLSSFGLASHRAAREQHGALTVCDRAGSHILSQDEILREEYARAGVRYPGIAPRLIERELAEYEICDLITVPSSFAMRSFVEKGVSPAKLRRVSYGVDLSMFRPAPKSDSIFRVLYVGSVSLRKGLAYLFDASARSGIPGAETWVIGAVDPEMRPILARHEGKFRHLGVLPRAELHNYYCQASVCVLPSVEDGFGLVMAQAMACGVPVIATTNTGAEDLFTDGVEGFIVPIRDPGAIAEKLIHLYENPGVRDAMGAAALARVRALGGWNSYGDAMAACYQTALRQRPGRAGHDANTVR